MDDSKPARGPLRPPVPAGWRRRPTPFGRSRGAAAHATAPAPEPFSDPGAPATRVGPWRRGSAPILVRREVGFVETDDAEGQQFPGSGVRAWVIDRPLRVRPDREALAIIPLRGVARVTLAGEASAVCAGRGLFLPDPGVVELVPDAFTGCLSLVLVLDGPARKFVQQGLPPWHTAFDTEELLVTVLDELGPLVRRETDALALEHDHLLVEFLLWHYGAHRDAILRLPGQHERRRGLYERLLAARRRCEDDVDTRIGELGARVHLSQAHFVRLFRSVFGHGPQQHLIHCRVTRAMNLLAWTGLAVAEVAAACGYRDRTAFSRAFGNLGGMSPAAFRTRVQRERDRIGPFFELRYEIFRC